MYEKAQFNSYRYGCFASLRGTRPRGWGPKPAFPSWSQQINPNNPGGNPDLPSGDPFTDVQSAGYWSATTSDNVWDVLFHFGIVNLADKDLTLFAWCVRGGQGVDPQ